MFKSFLSVLLIFAGAFLIFWGSTRVFLPGGFILKPSPTPSSFANQVSNVKPIKLYIPKIRKILAISDGVAIGNRWTISETGVSYLTPSALPGQVGNSVIYGHNRREILGDLPQVKIGDFVWVVLSNGDFVKYQIFEMKEVTPQQVEILTQTSDRRLTIYTCSGFLDQARFVVIGRMVGN